MAASATALSFSLWFLVFLHGCVAQIGFAGQSSWQIPRGPAFFGQKACRFERVEALEPLRRVQHEAGVTEYYDENNEQLRCAGLSVRRRIINPRGLRLPAYSNAPSLVSKIYPEALEGAPWHAWKCIEICLPISK